MISLMWTATFSSREKSEFGFFKTITEWGLLPLMKQLYFHCFPFIFIPFGVDFFYISADIFILLILESKLKETTYVFWYFAYIQN